MTAHELLLAIFNSNRNIVEIPFKEEYHNGTGYLDKLCVEDLSLPVATRFHFTMNGQDGRRGVGVVTPVGNIVFFERFSEGFGPAVVVMNYPHGLAGLYPGGQVSADTLSQAMGGDKGFGMNIGEVLGNVTKVLKEEPKDPLDTPNHREVVEAILTAPTPEILNFKATDRHGDRGVVCKVIDDTSNDYVPFGSLPPEAYARMARTRAHAEAEILHPSNIDMSDLLSRIEVELQKSPRTVPSEMVKELAAMLPENEYNHRRALLALSIATDASESLPVIMDRLRGMSKEDVGRIVQYTLTKWLPLKAAVEAQAKPYNRS